MRVEGNIGEASHRSPVGLQEERGVAEKCLMAQAHIVLHSEAQPPKGKNHKALPIGTQRFQLPVVIAVCGGLVPNIDFIFQDFREALRTSLFFCCYEVCHIGIRGPLFEIFVRISQYIC